MIAVDTSLARLRPIRTSDVTADAERLLLGTDSTGTTWFAARMPVEGPRAGLREVGAELSGDEVALATTAIALDNWHGAHARCSRCGVITVPAQAGWIRRCPEEGSEHYPRTDPAVIVLVLDEDDRALLGRQARWQPSWFSTLAGFVEPGESAEAAVRREILEEAGVTVDAMTYLGSQPWPFPCSLMLGYHAGVTSTDIVVDGEEIVEARWFSREELAAACASGEVALPPAVSIARRLIERWYGEPMSGDWIRP
jgi:NAD+ diphosphatase